MSNIIAALVTVAVILVGAGTMAQSGLTSADLITEQFRDLEARYGDRLRTNLEVVSASLTVDVLEVTVRNTGTTPLLGFDEWDVVVEFEALGGGSYHQSWIPYTASNPPGINEWTITGIYRDAQASQAEVTQPGILDPGEEAVIEVLFLPVPAVGVVHKVTVGTYNAVAVSTTF